MIYLLNPRHDYRYGLEGFQSRAVSQEVVEVGRFTRVKGCPFALLRYLIDPSTRPVMYCMSHNSTVHQSTRECSVVSYENPSGIEEVGEWLHNSTMTKAEKMKKKEVNDCFSLLRVCHGVDSTKLVQVVPTSRIVWNFTV